MMSYLTDQQVQAWLNSSKYSVPSGGVDPQFVSTAADILRSALSVRYDTSTWVDSSTTPPLVLNLMSMLVASYYLRNVVSEDDGAHDYPDWLEKRVQAVIDAIVKQQLEVPGAVEDPDSAQGLVPTHWPTQEATDLWLNDPDPNDPNQAALAFTMEMRF